MYQVLYRKYRPKKFSDVYGQPHITSTLLGELRTGRIAHAYLFTGTRGTGKTTCAKIFAKAINCLNSKDGDPCCECEICKGIDDGSVLDIVEIDAASNNGVEYIRELRETANFTPASAKYRVYIIDEVHMLSDSAFNALLKTLEEPPEYLVFILATTEIHKVPATIMSRCQRFDFHRIPINDMVVRLKQVFKEENINITEDALRIIAKFADGALRDALSLLDRCISACGNDEITVEKAVKAIGSTGKDHLFEISNAISNNNTAEVLSIINRLYYESKDMAKLCDELISHYRDLMMVKLLKKPSEIINATPDEITALMNAAHNLNTPRILRATEIFQKAQQNIRAGAIPRTEMEMALIKLTNATLDDSTTALLDRISSLENKTTSIPVTTPKVSVPTKSQEVEPKTDNDDELIRLAETASDNYQYASIDDIPEEELEDTEIKSGPQSDEETWMMQWPDILDQLRSVNPFLKASLVGTRALIRDDVILIDSDNQMFRDSLKEAKARNDLKNAAYAVLGKMYRIGPYSPPQTKKESKPVQTSKNEEKPVDPLDGLINDLNNKSINFNIE